MIYTSQPNVRQPQHGSQWPIGYRPQPLPVQQKVPVKR